MSSPKSPPRRGRRRADIHLLMEELARRILRYASPGVGRRLEARKESRRMGTAVIILLPPGEHEDPAPEAVGLPFSAEERQLLEKLADLKTRRPAEKVSGPQLCKLAGVPYDNPGRHLLRNLVNRQCLVLDEAEGYSLPAATQ